MKINPTVNIDQMAQNSKIKSSQFVIGLFIYILVLSCNSDHLSKRKLKEIIKEYQASICNVDSILSDSVKIKKFHLLVRKIYGSDFKANYIDTRRILYSVKPKISIGLYSFRPNGAHFPYTNYILNYADSISFLEKKDTIEWNKKINLFININCKYLNQDQINILKKEILVKKN